MRRQIAWSKRGLGVFKGLNPCGTAKFRLTQISMNGYTVIRINETSSKRQSKKFIITSFEISSGMKRPNYRPPEETHVLDGFVNG